MDKNVGLFNVIQAKQNHRCEIHKYQYKHSQRKPISRHLQTLTEIAGENIPMPLQFP